MTDRNDPNYRTPPPPPSSLAEPQLSVEDQRLLDALAEHGFDPSALSRPGPAEAKRAEAITNLLDLMHDYPVEDADDTLIHATMARIDRYEADRANRMKFDVAVEANQQSSRRRLMLPNFITSAAVLLIAVSVMWPVMTNVRNQSMDLTCQNNLKTMGYAFNQYAADFNNALPMATAGLGGFGGFGSRSAAPSPSASNDPALLDMQPLLAGGFCEPGHCTCPGHAHYVGDDGSPSYSVRLFVVGSQAAWNTGRTTVLIGDLNPMIEAAQSGHRLPPLSMTINHAGRGQNVLSSDGATLWLESPIINRGGYTTPVNPVDNIWLPDGQDELRSGIMPRDAMDVLLMH